MDFCLVFKLETFFFQRETNNFVFKATLSHENYIVGTKRKYIYTNTYCVAL